jgi:GNAT superfamily N-acetyltransferase
MARSGHVKKMARGGEAQTPPAQPSWIDAVALRQRDHDPAAADGDTETVAALFDRLGDGSREKRFCGGKRRLSDAELASLARVDADHHVLVAYLDGDRDPVGIARLARANGAAEVAFEVADEYQGRGVGSTLVRELAADARAVGISEFVAMVCRDNPGAVALLKQVAKSPPRDVARARARVRRRARDLAAPNAASAATAGTSRNVEENTATTPARLAQRLARV